MADIYRSRHSPHLVHRQRSQNSVLVKDDVGRARPSCYDLPDASHFYGVSESEGALEPGVREALSWSAHTPSPPPRRGVDFQRLNKAAVEHRATTPKKLSHFRAKHHFLHSPPYRGTPPTCIPSDVIPGFSYGSRSRPATPIGAVLSNQYSNAMEEEREERYRYYDEERARQGGPLKFKRTKAAGSWRRPPPMEPQDPMKLWKMSKFQKVPSNFARDSTLPAMSSSTSAPELPKVVSVDTRSMRSHASRDDIEMNRVHRGEEPDYRRAVLARERVEAKVVSFDSRSLRSPVSRDKKEVSRVPWGEEPDYHRAMLARELLEDKAVSVDARSTRSHLSGAGHETNRGRCGEEPDFHKAMLARKLLEDEVVSREAYSECDTESCAETEVNSEVNFDKAQVPDSAARPGGMWDVTFGAGCITEAYDDEPVKDDESSPGVEHENISSRRGSISRDEHEALTTNGNPCAEDRFPRQRRVETLVKLLLTVRHALPDELESAICAVVCCVRRHFSDSDVKVLEVALEDQRQALREERPRYLAWGPGVLRDRSAFGGGKCTTLSPIIMSVKIRHASQEELELSTQAVVERIRSNFREEMVHVREVSPSILESKGVRAREVALRYPLRPRLPAVVG